MVRIYRILFINQAFDTIDETFCLSRNEAVLRASREVDEYSRKRHRPRWTRCVVSEMDISSCDGIVVRPIVTLDAPVYAR